jgi:glycosyltransferase involved in cell wall biosynthesis
MHGLSNKQPLVSVIVPVYNIEKYVHEALLSVEEQTYNNIELIVIDDGSTDASFKVIDQVLQNYSRKFQIVSQENKGLAYSRNTGLNLSSGKYIYFFDGDDVIKNNTLENLVKHAEQTQSDIVLFAGCTFTKKVEDCAEKFMYSSPGIFEAISGKEMLNQLLIEKRYSASVPLIFFKKKFLIEYSLLFNENYYHEDEPFTVEALILGERVISLPDKFYMRRVRHESITQSTPERRHIEGNLFAAKKIMNLIKVHDLQKEFSNRLINYAKSLCRNAMNALGDYNRIYGFNHKIVEFDHYKIINEFGIKLRLFAKFPFVYNLIRDINDYKKMKRSSDVL